MMTTEALGRRIDRALGREPADLVLKGGRFLDVATGRVLDGDVAVSDGVIVSTGHPAEGAEVLDARGAVVVPGFIDAHVHVESSLLTPDGFEALVLPHGTTTAVADPHEIANVLGRAGLEYFLESARVLTLDLYIMLSSCVPATPLDTGGARLTAEDLAAFADHPRVLGLAEMMNVPGLLDGDPEARAKVAAFNGRHVDGHAPLVTGRRLDAYAAAGVATCHESTTYREGLEKLTKGLAVFMRQGSVSRDVTALAPLLTHLAAGRMAFCTDDRNPLDIGNEGHIDHAIRAALAAGASVPAVYRAAGLSAARAFGLRDRGMVAPGWKADLVLLDDPKTCAVRQVVKDGRVVPANGGLPDAPVPPPPGRGSVHRAPVAPDAFRPAPAPAHGPVIGLRPGSLVTDYLVRDRPLVDGRPRADPGDDLQKIAVLCRHGPESTGIGFVSGFGLRAGALAATVGHDSHNIGVVGVDDTSMATAVNRLIAMQGGYAVASGDTVLADLPLPVAGLMTDQPAPAVRRALRHVREAAGELGCPLDDPLLQLAFLQLPVIPHLKITDRGLVDVDAFRLVE